MSNLVLLSEVLQSPKDFGYNEDIKLREIAHEPTCGTLILPKNKTGWHEEQLIVPQKKHTWYPFLYKGKTIITAGETTDFELSLAGERGYNNGVDSLREINKLYISKMTEVADITKDMYEEMPESLKAMCYLYWLLGKCEPKNLCSFGLLYVNSSGVRYSYLYRYGLCSESSSSYSYAVRPTLYIKPGVRIDLDQLLGTKGFVKLYPPESETESQEIQKPQIVLPN